MQLVHHGGHEGVTGSCHQLQLNNGTSVLVDCGLFQGDDAARHPQLEIEFSLDGIAALLLTHVHIDHVGRLPYLMAAGFAGPIYCSRPTARLLPLVMEDALKIGFTRKERMIRAFLERIGDLLRPVDYGSWQELDGLRFRFHVAGHILGSAWIEIEAEGRRVVFSGDLGAPHAPLLKDPQSPEGADLLVLESTYGDKRHEGRDLRRQRLEQILRKTLKDKGVTIIPAFSLGRTQELLYEMNGIFEQIQQDDGMSLMKRVDVIVDSPLAARFTEIYQDLQPFWDAEAQEVLTYDDQPLVFENLTTIGDHDEHRSTLEYLKNRDLPAVVIAGSGMCTGGRVVNYLKAFLDRPHTDVVFVGYQGSGTPGRRIQGGREAVELDGKEYPIRAKVHSLSGYSAHADQQNLLDFVHGMSQPPGEVVLVHGERDAKAALKTKLQSAGIHVR
ncbi:MAG: MBL fold metallo-hydrolase [Planctomycetales bacterium]|nr:MBL fold metallo-hydrolase [Planctomycetales bacterium]NIO46629.1 MBL fold metallo-hydrolase [Planctomycetales bacterium]NIP85754.1 MBL fold metallo-hydrolase [Planctomycetales bacterium]